MRLPVAQQNSRVQRQRQPLALSRLALLLFSGAVLTGGFIFAARQHFAAVKYGYVSEELREEREQLLREQQQLLLKKEQVSSPRSLESAARKLGLKPLSPNQVSVLGPGQAATSAQAKVDGSKKKKTR